MKLGHKWAVGLLALLSVGSLRAADTAAKDPLKDAGLTKSGTVFVLSDEAAILDAVKSLRLTKTQADKETKARQVMDGQIAAKRKTITDNEKQWHELNNRLPTVVKPEAHNGIVLRMNRLIADAKNAAAAEKDLEEQAGKLSISSKTKYVDDLIALNTKADAVSQKYLALAGDAAVKAAIAKTPSSPKATLGPSADFATALADVKKMQSEIDSETIPLHEDGGIRVVDVLVNGERLQMGIDTGASSMTLTGEVADKLKIIPGDQDPTVRLSLADGNEIEGREVTVKSVRVGRFTVDDVKCVILQKNLHNAPLLLGNSFLNHFIVKLDPSTNELHLTEIARETAPKAASTAKPAAATDKAP